MSLPKPEPSTYWKSMSWLRKTNGPSNQVEKNEQKPMALQPNRKGTKRPIGPAKACEEQRATCGPCDKQTRQQPHAPTISHGKGHSQTHHSSCDAGANVTADCPRTVEGFLSMSFTLIVKRFCERMPTGNYQRTQHSDDMKRMLDHFYTSNKLWQDWGPEWTLKPK